MNEVFELLEDLPHKFRKKLDGEVSMTEITRYSLQINDKAWVVVTNSKIYVLKKKLWFITCQKHKLSQVFTSEVENGKFIIKTDSDETSLPVNSDRVKHVSQLADNIQELTKS